MGMDLTVSQVFHKNHSSSFHQKLYGFELSAKQLEFLKSKNAFISNVTRNWIVNSTFTDEDLIALLGFDYQEDNKKPKKAGDLDYYISYTNSANKDDELCIQGNLKSIEIESVFDDVYFYKEKSDRIVKTVDLPEGSYEYVDSYWCDLISEQVAYYRKPFRHSSTVTESSEPGTMVFKVDNFTDKGEEAYKILVEHCKDSYGDVTFTNIDYDVLKKLASLSNDIPFWEKHILDPIKNDVLLLVNINW